jgi:hypothetical protein
LKVKHNFIKDFVGEGVLELRRDQLENENRAVDPVEKDEPTALPPYELFDRIGVIL